MRILIVHPGPDFSVHDVFRGWTDALKALGAEVAVFNTNDRLIFYSKALIDTEELDETGHPIVRQAMTQEQALHAAMQGLSHACYTFWPDVILFVSAFFIPDAAFAIIRQRHHKIVLLHTESPYQEEEQLHRGGFADLNLLNDPQNLDSYTGIAPAVYMPHAYRPSVHYPRRGPRDPELASDLAFIGTAFESRVTFFEAMDFGRADVLIGGSDWDAHTGQDSQLRRYFGHDPDKCVDNSEAAELYRHAKAGINFYRRESEDDHAGEGWAMGPREIEMAACGLFFLRDPRPESDKVFPMLPSFAGPEDASEQLQWWLAHDRERDKAARAARLAIADRTFENNARRLLALLDS